MDVAGDLSKPPRPTGEEVVDQFREESDHQTQITNGQIHDQHVRRSTKRWAAAEDAQHAVVAERSDNACIKIQLHVGKVFRSTHAYINNCTN